MNKDKRLERGSTLITVAITLLVLVFFLALAVDAGMAYAERRKMQNAADAASLAGATVLINGGSDANVKSTIASYVAQNSASDYTAVYLPSGQAVGGGVIPADATGVRVTARRTSPTFFAGIMGINSMSVSGVAGGGFPPLDIALVLDRSGSMNFDSCSAPPQMDTDPICMPISEEYCTQPLESHSGHDWYCGGTWTEPPQPMTDTQNAAKSFVDMNNPILSNLALVSFSSDCCPGIEGYSLDQPLTNNFGSVKSAIDSLDAWGGTNADGGLYTAIEELAGPRGRDDATQYIVFLTDGHPNQKRGVNHCSGSEMICEEARQAVRDDAAVAADEHIIIYTIGLGESADMSLLHEVADTTGGLAYYAPSSGDLDAIYQDIFQRIQLRLVQ